MKKIEAIIRPSKVSDVCAALEKVGHPGITISEIEGHGNQSGMEQEARGKKYKIGLLNKARIEVVVNDNDLDKITKTIRETAYTGKVGDGKIFIYSVEDAVRIRTAEHGNIAV